MYSVFRDRPFGRILRRFMNKVTADSKFGFMLILRTVSNGMSYCFSKVKMKHAKYRPNTQLEVLLLAMAMVTAASTQVFTGWGNSLHFDNMVPALSTLTTLAMANANRTSFVLHLGEKMVGISDFSLEFSGDFEGGSTRDKTPLGASWVEYHIVDEGSKWRVWKPASCVHINKGREPKLIKLHQATSSIVSAIDSFNFELAFESGTLSGYDLVWANEAFQFREYLLPAEARGQVWSSQWLYWQKQRSRSCDTMFQTGKEIICGAWGPTVRGFIPVENGQVFEWDLGIGFLDIHTCGGGS